MSDGRTVIIKSLVNGGDLKRFRLNATQLSAGALLDQVCEQHASLERGKFSTKLEVKDRPALQPLGTQALRDALAAAGGETANSVVLRLFSFSVSAARRPSFCVCPYRCRASATVAACGEVPCDPVALCAGPAEPRGFSCWRRLAAGSLVKAGCAKCRAAVVHGISCTVWGTVVRFTMLRPAGQPFKCT